MSALENRKTVSHITGTNNMREVLLTLEQAVIEAKSKAESITSTKIFKGVFVYQIVNSEGTLTLFRRTKRGNEDKQMLLADASASDPVYDITRLFFGHITD